MNKTATIQTKNVSTITRDKAEKRAQMEGFDSVQAAIRYFLVNYADGNISLQYNPKIPTLKLTPGLIEALEDVKAGRLHEMPEGANFSEWIETLDIDDHEETYRNTYNSLHQGDKEDIQTQSRTEEKD